MKKFVCRVCGKRFDNLMHHLEEYNDKKHNQAYKKIYSNLYLGKQTCLCGGKIETYSWIINEDGDVSWESICERCGYLWDED